MGVLRCCGVEIMYCRQFLFLTGGFTFLEERFEIRVRILDGRNFFVYVEVAW